MISKSKKGQMICFFLNAKKKKIRFFFLMCKELVYATMDTVVVSVE